MSDEVLSQDEVESLLSAMEASVPTVPTAADVQGTRTAKQVGRTRDKVVPYDFKRPERVGKEQMRALQSLHEGFGRNFGAAISGMLRTMVDVNLTSVDQLTYSEFVFSLENPTCFNLLKAEPLDGNLILDISPGVLYPIIDRLLGGGKETSATTRRPLTDIELRLVSRVTNVFLEQLKKAWENVLTLELSVERVESNPQLVQVVPPNEVVILISFELTIGEVRGMLNFCVPYNAIEPYSSKLAANTWVSFAQSGTTPESQQQIARQLDGSLVEMVVTLAETSITTADLIGLRVGDVITTETDIRQPLDVKVEGVPKFAASPGALKGKKAIQLVSSQPSKCSESSEV